MPNASKNNTTIAHLFDLLDRWRHLPAYQLERRADIFFALFLPEVLGKHLKVDINPILVPEFPIRKSNTNRNLSNKIDYFALSKDEERAFLVELKTDTKSINKDQIEILKCTHQKGIDKIIGGLKSIAKSKSVAKSPPIRKKYFHMLRALSDLSLIEIPDMDNLKKLLFSGPFRTDKYNKYIQGIDIKICPRSLEIVYILPENNDLIPSCWHRIYFDSFADHAIQGSSIGCRFAESLYRWKEPAGSCPPQP